MPIILKKFKTYLEKYKHFSIKTVKSYVDDLLLFFEFLKMHFNLEFEVKDINIFVLKNVNSKTIYSFLVYLNYYKNNTASTRIRRLEAIKRFYKYLYLYYPSFRKLPNPIKNITLPLNVVRLPKYLNFEQAKCIQNIFTRKNCRFPERNNAIITVFLHTGLRITELSNLSISSFDFVKKRTKVIGKGNVERYVYFNDYTIAIIQKYLKTRNDDCDALFISSRIKRISIDAIEDICKKAFMLIGFTDTTKYSAHTLRHTAATLIYRSTKDLLLTKEFLRHKSISSTEIYSHIENYEVKNAVERNPLSNFGV